MNKCRSSGRHYVRLDRIRIKINFLCFRNSLYFFSVQVSCDIKLFNASVINNSYPFCKPCRVYDDVMLVCICICIYGDIKHWSHKSMGSWRKDGYGWTLYSLTWQDFMLCPVGDWDDGCVVSFRLGHSHRPVHFRVFFDKAKEEDESKKKVETEIFIMLINIEINNFYRKADRTTWVQDNEDLNRSSN